MGILLSESKVNYYEQTEALDIIPNKQGEMANIKQPLKSQNPKI
jgi:hypothetical protein